MSLPYAKVIVNPAAGGWSTRWRWPRISERLRDAGLSFDSEFTEGAGHAVELAQAAVNQGYRYLVAVGGDGTVNEVVNGILQSAGSADVTLGVISTGTANSFVRSAGIPREYNRACSLLVSPRRMLMDVGVVECRAKGPARQGLAGGQPLQRYFVNVAGVGFDAAIVEETKPLPKYFSGYISYLAGLPGCLLKYRNKAVVLSLEGKIEVERVLSVMVANGCYLGGGMNMAPGARLGDGLLDVVIIGDMGKVEALKTLPMVYKGTHITHPKVRLEKAKRIAIESSDGVLVQADGELLGECPASFWLVPSALSVVA